MHKKKLLSSHSPIAEQPFPIFLRNRPRARWKHVVDDTSLQPAIQPVPKVRNGSQRAEQHPVETNRAKSTDTHLITELILWKHK